INQLDQEHFYPFSGKLGLQVLHGIFSKLRVKKCYILFAVGTKQITGSGLEPRTGFIKNKRVV
ncbi:MAG: hypothetical protein WCH85_10575, partial [Methanomicrobiales archaeon]